MGHWGSAPGDRPWRASAQISAKPIGPGDGPRLRALVRIGAALFVAVSALAPAAFAQSTAVRPGVVEREFQEGAKPRPGADIVIPSLETPRAWEDAQSVRFVLARVDIEGNAALSDQELQAPFEALIGNEVSIGQIFAAADAVTRLYDAAGYALSLAYVPAQEVTAGIVRIRVVEGYIGEVSIKDTQSSRSSRWDDFAERLKESRPLRTETLERYLLLINDQAGVKAKSFFERLENGTPGAMRLVVNIERKLLDAHAEVNNRGSAAVGPLRGFLNLDLNGLLGNEEKLSVFGVTTLGSNELVYVGTRIIWPLWSEGTLITLEAARSETEPGTPTLSAIEFDGDGWTGSGKVSHAFIRSLRENLTASISLAYKNLKSRLVGAPYSHDRLSVLGFELDYDSRDRWGGLWHVVGTVLVGLDIFDATRKSDPLSSRAGASGQFLKFEGSVSMLRPLSSRVSLYGELAGQVADGPLLVSELCGYGGGHIGRAFDPFEISGDHCIKGRAELRVDLPLGKRALGRILDSAQFYVLADFGVVMKSGTLLPTETRTQNAESIGLGLRFQANENLSGFVEVAHPLGRGVALENGSRDARLFFGVSTDY
jgi:hemolysin activation/secretion protein